MRKGRWTFYWMILWLGFLQRKFQLFQLNLLKNSCEFILSRLKTEYAGPIRNEEMAEVSDALIAFWDGKSRGTKSMIEIARRKGLQVAVVKY